MLPATASRNVGRDVRKNEPTRERPRRRRDGKCSNAVASLSRLSPSRIVRMRCGGRSCRRTAVAAAASGGATMAPSAIAAAQGIAGTSACATHATAAVVRPTRDHDERQQRRPVVPEIARRRVVGRVQQHRRDEQRERELGLQHERRERLARTPGRRRRAPGTRDTARRLGAPRPPGERRRATDQ